MITLKAEVVIGLVGWLLYTGARFDSRPMYWRRRETNEILSQGRGLILDPCILRAGLRLDPTMFFARLAKPRGSPFPVSPYVGY